MGGDPFTTYDIIFSDDWGVQSPPKHIVFRFHETILSFGEPGSLGKDKHTTTFRDCWWSASTRHWCSRGSSGRNCRCRTRRCHWSCRLLSTTQNVSLDPLNQAIPMGGSVNGIFTYPAWRVILVSKWLITMVSKSPKWGCSPYTWPKWLINGGY